MKIIKNILLFSLLASLFIGCANEDMAPLYGQQEAGKVVIRSYSALEDSLQVIADGKILEIGTRTTFTGKIVTDYEFIFYHNKTEHLDIVNKTSGETLKSYSFTPNTPIDTLSFYTMEGIWIDNVLDNKPGVLSVAGHVGYRFIFPTMNRYSNSGYNGPVDAIVKKINGQLLGVVENISKDHFSNFIEFAYTPPPILNVELVKHGTTESYVTGQQVIVQMVIQNNKSKLIILDEKVDESGVFAGVNGTLNLADYFDF